MASKLIILVTLVAVALAFPERPHLGFRQPSWDFIGGHIVGGENAKDGDFPWQVSIQRHWILGSYHSCGGSVVAPSWILTAAHCVPSTYADITVRAGIHSLRASTTSEQKRSITKAIIHENYAGGVAPYDIALLKLSEPLVLGDKIRAISLPKPESVPEGDSVLSGWGSTSPSGISQMPDILQTVRIPVVPLDVCKESIEGLTGPSPLHVTNVCTGPLTGGVSACSGDSGGPLISADKNPVLIGIVSWGIIPCGTVGAPSVYTRVSAFNKWIADTMKNN